MNGIRDLIGAYEYLRDNPKILYWEDLPRIEVFETIKLLTNKEDLLEAYQELLDIEKGATQLSETTPRYILDNLDAYLKEENAEKKSAARAKFLYDERILRAKRVNLAIEATQKLKIPTPSPATANVIAGLKQNATNNPLGFHDSLIAEISKDKNLSNDEVVTIANTFTKALGATPAALAVEATLADPKSKLIKELAPDLERSGDQEDTRKKLQAVYQKNNNDLIFTRNYLLGRNIVSDDAIRGLIPDEALKPQEGLKVEVNSQKPLVTIDGVKIIETTNPTNPREVTSQSFEDLFNSTTKSQTKAEIPYIEGVAPSGRFWTSPTAVNWGLKELAKEDPKLATTLTLSSQKMEDLVRMGMDPRTARLYFDELRHIEESGSKIDWIKEAMIAQSLSLDARQVQLIKNRSSLTFALYDQAFTPPHQSFFENIANNLGQRLFGGTAKNFIKNSLGKAITEKFTTSVVGKAISTVTGTVTGGLVNAGMWLLDRAVNGFRSKSEAILTGSGAVLGFIAGGPIGALIGAGLGGAIAGVDWKKYAQYALIALTALFSAFLGAIAVPLIIAFVGIPIMVALILFIINAGAYVVPPSTGVGGRAGSNPKNCFVLDNTWTEPYKSQVEAAAEEISKAGFYMDKICTKDITLTLGAQEYFRNTDPPIALGGETLSADLIKLFPYGLSDLFVSTFTLAHESGHIAAIRTNLYQLYLDTPGLSSERPTCTYPVRPHNPQEDFAEIVGRYIGEPLRGRLTVWQCATRNSVVINVSPSASWKDNYPQNWQFGHDKIFEENLRWQ